MNELDNDHPLSSLSPGDTLIGGNLDSFRRAVSVRRFGAPFWSAVLPAVWRAVLAGAARGGTHGPGQRPPRGERLLPCLPTTWYSGPGGRCCRTGPGPLPSRSAGPRSRPWPATATRW